MPTVLLIEDDLAIAESLTFVLAKEAFAVHHVTLSRDALQCLRQKSFDVVVMDVGLPDGNGFVLCQQVRQFSSVPILFLTAHADTLEREMGLELGADDYVTKPFSLKEVVLRIKALLRRSQPATVNQSGFVDDAARKQIMFNGRTLILTRSEYLLLQTMLAQPERVFSREQLLNHLPNSDDSSDRVIDTLIKQLRAKLRDAGAGEEMIVTHRGLGYSVSRS